MEEIKSNFNEDFRSWTSRAILGSEAAMATRKRNGHANGSSSNVRREDFAKDPSRYVDRARERGPVTITDAQGKPRMMIVVPKAITAFHED
jgi:hypothetical protein